ncbi:MAG: hypothetical protein B7X53_04165 [Hyphomonas sp. 34-62-18]|nr:hypothetical protein [Hyphomonas sp. 34-62-18]OZB18146.1 MAG: hypothetical protein B7X53_04165 [Hyphomonas sp. 34-62-18]
MRKLAAAGALLALFPAAGCATWQDRAEAKALTNCQDKADEEERRLCRETVIAAEKAKYDKESEAWEESVREAEDRELQRQIYGGPGQVDK